MTWSPHDRLHRLEKLLMDRGLADTQAEAEAILRSYRIQLVVGPETTESLALQAALLTAANCARRSIHGRLTVVGKVNVPLRLPFAHWPTLAAALVDLGAELCTAPEKAPSLVFGTASLPRDELILQVTFDRWAGGVKPGLGVRLPERGNNTLAGTIAGALGVSELFQALQGGDARLGRRSLGLSVWDPAQSWELSAEIGPELEYLPANLWVIGLGHLGQALLWNMGMLPYVNPTEVNVMVHDVDRLVPANVSTAPLTKQGDMTRMKTRVMAEWVEARGFNSRIIERPFTRNYRVEQDDPRLCFCGVDNAEARAALEECGFEAIVECGLGVGDAYLAYQLHTFPGPYSAVERWSNSGPASHPVVSEGIKAVAADGGLDECGLTELAGIKVGASFVGLVASALAIGQMMRPLHGTPMLGAISGTLALASPAAAVAGKVGVRPVRYGAAVARSD